MFPMDASIGIRRSYPDRDEAFSLVSLYKTAQYPRADPHGTSPTQSSPSQLSLQLLSGINYSHILLTRDSPTSYPDDICSRRRTPS